jgi:hypothetical protein
MEEARGHYVPDDWSSPDPEPEAPRAFAEKLGSSGKVQLKVKESSTVGENRFDPSIIQRPTESEIYIKTKTLKHGYETDMSEVFNQKENQMDDYVSPEQAAIEIAKMTKDIKGAYLNPNAPQAEHDFEMARMKRLLEAKYGITDTAEGFYEEHLKEKENQMKESFGTSSLDGSGRSSKYDGRARQPRDGTPMDINKAKERLASIQGDLNGPYHAGGPNHTRAVAEVVRLMDIISGVEVTLDGFEQDYEEDLKRNAWGE